MTVNAIPGFYANSSEQTGTLFNGEFTSYLLKAKEIALSLTSLQTVQEKSEVNEKRYYYYHYRPFSSFYWPFYTYWPSPLTIINITPEASSSSSSGRKEKKDNLGSRILLGATTLATIGYGLYQIGKGISKQNEAEEELKDAQDFKKKIKFLLKSNPTNEHLLKFKEINHLQKKILKNNKTSASYDKLIAITLVAGSAMSLGGAVYDIGLLISTGLITGTAALGGMIFKLGFDSTDTRNKRSAKKIIRDIDNLNMQSAVQTATEPEATIPVNMNPEPGVDQLNSVTSGNSTPPTNSGTGFS
jgi:hypothetical protein